MDRINELIKNASSVAVIGHVRPDGDCVGSCLALQNYLKDTNPDLRTDVFLGAFSDVFRFLKERMKSAPILKQRRPMISASA